MLTMLRIGVALGILAIAPASTVAQTYVAHALQSPLGASYCYAFSTNDSGLVTGTCSFENVTHGVVWRDGIPAVLPTLPGFIGSEATGLNQAGLVVGGCYTATTVHACAWENGLVRALPVPEGTPYGFAVAVNQAGVIVGSAGASAALWRNGVLELLPSQNAVASEAQSINDLGVVVGSVVTNSGQQPARWDDLGLALLPLPVGVFWGTATCVNNAGQVVGYGDGGAVMSAILWAAGTPQLLPVTSGVQHSRALGINDSGQVSGLSEAGGVRTAVLWPPASAPISLSDSSAIDSYGLLISEAGVVAGVSDGVATLFAPQTASEAATELSSVVDDLIATGDLQGSAANSLNTHITAAVDRIAAGNAAAAIGVLSAFQNKVAATLKAGQITQGDAQALLDAAEAIKSKLR